MTHSLNESRISVLLALKFERIKFFLKCCENGSRGKIFIHRKSVAKRGCCEKGYHRYIYSLQYMPVERTYLRLICTPNLGHFKKSKSHLDWLICHDNRIETGVTASQGYVHGGLIRVKIWFQHKYCSFIFLIHHNNLSFRNLDFILLHHHWSWTNEKL